MTLERARKITVFSTKQALTEEVINQDILNDMILKRDKLKGKRYKATWINRNAKCKLILNAVDIHDSSCPIFVWILAT